MRQCIENAIAAGHITRGTGEYLNRELNRQLREGIAPPEIRQRLMDEAAVAAQEIERRALLTEAVVLNYLALHNRVGQFGSVLPMSGLGAGALDGLTAFQPIV